MIEEGLSPSLFTYIKRSEDVFDFISESISDFFLNREIINKEQWSELEYRIRFLSHNIVTICGLIYFAYVFNCIFQMIVISIFFNISRMFINGHHSNTLEKCVLLTWSSITIGSIFANYLSKYPEFMSAMAISLLLVIIFKYWEIKVDMGKKE